ncbi:hypothetical protein [Paraburkholderia sp. MM5384-R2]|uniref:hypothetical protein n=1 Tax=Paraburkholderia sp. MM5384-R2 TaxID=2723097 RepID=UPI00161B179F|nr:hypothetical protein [Paraburkholderia sp. MM5384-R2]MBB5497546.1 hypothetical protein [Paraburkholderia sp. MM5384-R2]
MTNVDKAVSSAAFGGAADKEEPLLSHVGSGSGSISWTSMRKELEPRLRRSLVRFLPTKPGVADEQGIVLSAEHID